MKSPVFSSIVLCILLMFSGACSSKDCNELKQLFSSNEKYSDLDVNDLQVGVESGSLCMKNLMGVMIYKGIYFSKDQNRAEGIFYDLANNDYPEAQFNFALLMTERKDQKPIEVISLLLGIYTKYLTDKKNIHLALKARDLGYIYISSLSESFALKDEDVNSINEKFKEGIKSASSKFAQDLDAQANASNENINSIMMIITIGMLTYGLGSLAAAEYNRYTPQWHSIHSPNAPSLYWFQ